MITISGQAEVDANHIKLSLESTNGKSLWTLEAIQVCYSLLRGRPLMIWGGRENREKNFLGGPSPGKKFLEATLQENEI